MRGAGGARRVFITVGAMAEVRLYKIERPNERNDAGLARSANWCLFYATGNATALLSHGAINPARYSQRSSRRGPTRVNLPSAGEFSPPVNDAIIEPCSPVRGEVG